MQIFSNWKITANDRNDELSHMGSIKLVSLYAFLKNNRIAPNDFLLISKKLRELYTLCNMETLRHTWDLKDGELFHSWSGNILFLGTTIKLESNDASVVECYPTLRLKMLKQDDVFRLVAPHHISRYELIGRGDYQVAVI